MNSLDQQYLSDFFPYDPFQKKHSELKKGLTEYRFFLCTASLAIQHLQDGNLEKFDSLVGENACQIRAIKIALIASDNSIHYKDLLLKIKNTLGIVDELLDNSSMQPLMLKGYTLKEIIDRYGLDIQLTSDEIFLIQSYLLSEMKESRSDGEILPSLLRIERCSPSALQKKHPNVSYSFIEKLAKKLREHLSKTSVDFVRKVASELQNPFLMKMVGKEFERKHNNLVCIPTFWTFKILFSLAKKRGIPLVIHVKFLNELGFGYRIVDEEILIFKPCQKKKTYLECELKAKDLEQPLCILQGVICPKKGMSLPSKEEWKDRMRSNSMIDLILAIGADHRQYPDPNLVPILEEEYMQYKMFAEDKGLSLTNPTTFFAQHMYCARSISRVNNYQSSPL